MPTSACWPITTRLKLKSRRIQDLDAAQIAALPAAVRPHVTSLRAHYDEVMRAQALAQPGHIADALDVRQPRLAPAADGGGEDEPAGVLSEVPHRATSLDHDAAIRALLARILVSPAFLYRVGDRCASGPEKPLNGWEMASRMSFFLWSSIPDEELRRAAAAGELSDPAMLARQVKRMTADPKARRLATEFFGQWLGFYHFDEYRGVDTGRFPEFTDEVKSAMYDEAVSTFEYIVRQRASGEGDPLRRLHVPQQAAGQVLRRRAGREVDATKMETGGRARTRSTAAARCGWAPC